MLHRKVNSDARKLRDMMLRTMDELVRVQLLSQVSIGGSSQTEMEAERFSVCFFLFVASPAFALSRVLRGASESDAYLPNKGALMEVCRGLSWWLRRLCSGWVGLCSGWIGLGWGFGRVGLAWASRLSELFQTRLVPTFRAARHIYRI